MLETLLANVPLEDFLHRPTKQQQKRVQVHFSGLTLHQASSQCSTVECATSVCSTAPHILQREVMLTWLTRVSSLWQVSIKPPMSSPLLLPSRLQEVQLGRPQMQCDSPVSPLIPPACTGLPSAHSFRSQTSLTFPDVAGADVSSSSPTWFGNAQRPLPLAEGLGDDGATPHTTAAVLPVPGGFLVQTPLMPPMPGGGYQAAAAAAMYKRSHDAMDGPEGHGSGHHGA